MWDFLNEDKDEQRYISATVCSVEPVFLHKSAVSAIGYKLSVRMFIDLSFEYIPGYPTPGEELYPEDQEMDYKSDMWIASIGYSIGAIIPYKRPSE